MDNPLISIIMPAYNAEKFISIAVESVKAQTYENWELIIVDDLSTDKTPEMIDAFQSEKIRVFHNSVNRKTSWTRNFAVNEAKGEWIAFLDADDAWEPDKLEKQISLLNKENNAALLFTGSAFMDETGTRKDYVLHVPQRIRYKELVKQNLISCSSVLIRKELVVKYPFPEMKEIHEDFAVWLSVLKKIDCAYGVDEPLLIYRISSGSKSANKLKAAKMNWNTYRYTGISFVSSARYMISYTIRGLRKYSHLK